MARREEVGRTGDLWHVVRCECPQDGAGGCGHDEHLRRRGRRCVCERYDRDEPLEVHTTSVRRPIASQRSRSARGVLAAQCRGSYALMNQPPVFRVHRHAKLRSSCHGMGGHCVDHPPPRLCPPGPEDNRGAVVRDARRRVDELPGAHGQLLEAVDAGLGGCGCVREPGANGRRLTWATRGTV